jgi:hypothetical protein
MFGSAAPNAAVTSGRLSPNCSPYNISWAMDRHSSGWQISWPGGSFRQQRLMHRSRSLRSTSQRGGWLKLLQLVDALSMDADRPFPGAQSLIALAQTASQLECQKPLRRTEKLWWDRRVNVRSTLWWKPRGGAPLAAACMKLFATARFPPCWPWSTQSEGLVVEAFPAAQLWSWKLPLQKYDGHEGTSARQEIIRGLESRINFGTFRKTAEETADALDAVISSFAAIAAFRGEATQPDADGALVAREGWIAVHS